jgi:hypothetical protein
MAMFKPATRKKLKLRMAINGPSGAGKTYSVLRLAFGLVGPNGRIAVIDSDHRSASKYLGESPDGYPWQFDVCELEHYSPSTYTQAIREAGMLGYDVIVIDSLSHAWEGTGGALDLVDKKSAAKDSNNFAAWRDVTPMHREMIETILASPAHVLATMRSKMDYCLEPDPKTGKNKVVKLGMAPIQRQGTEYEFDLVADMDLEHILTVSKTRCPAVDGARVVKPTAAWIDQVKRWLDLGTEAQVATTAVQPTVTVAAAATTTAHQLLQSAVDESRRPVAEDQVQRIKSLAGQLRLAPEVLKQVLAKRSVTRLADLTHLQAAALIEGMEGKLAQHPPFDPTGPKGNGNKPK